MTYEQPTLSLEGDYSVYSQLWLSNALTDLADVDHGFIDVPNNRVYLHGSSSRYAILNLATGAIITEAASEASFGSAKTMAASVLARYVAWAVSGTEIVVYKDGALLQTITIALKNINQGIVVSPDGQYVVFYDTTDDKVYCWKGA